VWGKITRRAWENHGGEGRGVFKKGVKKGVLKVIAFLKKEKTHSFS